MAAGEAEGARPAAMVGDEAGHGAAAAGEDDLLAVGDALEERGEMGLGSGKDPS